MATAVATDEKVEFVVKILAKKLGRFDSFPQAFAAYYAGLNKEITEGLPETCLGRCVISCFLDDELIGYLSYHEIRFLGDQMGLLVDGKLVEPVSEFDLQQEKKFRRLLIEQIIARAATLFARAEKALAGKGKAAAINLPEEQISQETKDRG